MEPSKEPSKDSGEKPRRVIKRYSNRKLYDTRDSRYVTLQQIGEMVRAGEEVQIIDNKTKEDKTEVTLALILSEDLKSQPRSVPLGALRDLIQERGGRLLTQLREGPIGRLIPGGGAEAQGATPPPPPEPPPPEVKEVVAEADKPAEKQKGRLSELMESSLSSIEDRISAILPSLKAWSELEAEVKRLSARVDELEAALAERQGGKKGS
jgi:polyhydroxyalkanoate synthesis repressor PhaR